MTQENLTIHEPEWYHLEKFHDINSMPDRIWEQHCVHYDDCSICPMAIHQYLLSTMKHTCTRGISEEKFRALMSDADCEY